MKSVSKLLAVATVAASAVLSGCGQKASDENVITVGAMAGSETQLVEAAKAVAKERFDLDVEIISFTDYVAPNVALEDGSIDVNAFQHKPYLDAQIEARGYDFVPVGNTFVYPLAGYSKKHTSVDALPEGATIAIPNDPSNGGRALILLEKQGLLTLKEGVGLTATPLDIADNPKGIKIKELDAAQLPRSLDDVDIAVINNSFAAQIDLFATRDGLFVEDKESPYVNLIVSRTDNKDQEKVQKFVQAYQSEPVHDLAQELFKNSIVKGW